MKTSQQLFARLALLLSMTLLLVVAAFPAGTVTAANPVPQAGLFTSDDFNACTLKSQWTYEPGAATVAPVLTGAYSGSAYLTLSVPAGKDATIEPNNLTAPRLMTSTVSNQDWEIEVKFLTPLNTPPANSWFIQGILVRDTTSVPGKTRWMRFELDDNSNGMVNYYIGYLDENGSLHGLVGPSSLAFPASTAPLYVGVKYLSATDSWSFSFHAGTDAGWHTKPAVTQAGFKPDGVGFFAGQTGTPASGLPGFQSKIDYVKNWTTDPNFTNDAITLTVNNAGAGTTSQTCAGNVVTLTANPKPGASFNGWSGPGVSGTQNPLHLTMTQSYNIVANFSGSAINLPFKVYAPTIAH